MSDSGSDKTAKDQAPLEEVKEGPVAPVAGDRSEDEVAIQKHADGEIVPPAPKDQGDPRRLAFVFVSFCVFTGTLFTILIQALQDSSSIKLLGAFDAFSIELAILCILVVHALRMQLGVVFNFEDDTFKAALARIPVKKQRVIVAHNTLIWLVLVLLVGSLPRMLTTLPWWAVFINLLGQSISILVWQRVNKPVLEMDKDRLGNAVLRIGDYLFVTVIFTSGVVAILRWVSSWWSASAPVAQWSSTGLSWVVGFALPVVVVVLGVEMKYTYGQSIAKALKQVKAVIRLEP